MNLNTREIVLESYQVAHFMLIVTLSCPQEPTHGRQGPAKHQSINDIIVIKHGLTKSQLSPHLLLDVPEFIITDWRN